MVRHVGIKKQKALNRCKQEVLKKIIKKTEKRQKKGTKQALPGIVVDIDGVVYRGKELIGDPAAVIRRVFTPVGDQKIPFVFLTNGGACTEQQKADELNKKIGLTGDDGIRIQHEHINLCSTIFFDPAFDKYKDQFVLVDSFSYDDGALAYSYGFKKCISVIELCSLYPDLSTTAIYDCL